MYVIRTKSSEITRYYVFYFGQYLLQTLKYQLVQEL